MKANKVILLLVDVRRAYEQCVLRATGAVLVPDAMLTIATLRVDEGPPRGLAPLTEIC